MKGNKRMDKKPFLRGFGTGVLFAAAILGISFTIRTSEPATIARAKKLGMVFESNNQKVLLSGTKKPEETVLPEESGNPGSTTVPDNTNAPADTTKPTGTQKPAEEKATEKPAVTKMPVTTKKPSKKDNDIGKQFDNEKNNLKKDIENEKKQLTINDGDWAGKVSKELEDMGIIDDAMAFDKYLSDNGYSNVINSGTYDVSPDDTYHELAEKITSRFK
ncbi:MAG: hypothetical protein HFH68_09510 [Lachnospiraceae bacterium]|nr:hypothetical protein [Lachnospiraceae bacterium]